MRQRSQSACPAPKRSIMSSKPGPPGRSMTSSDHPAAAILAPCHRSSRLRPARPARSSSGWPGWSSGSSSCLCFSSSPSRHSPNRARSRSSSARISMTPARPSRCPIRSRRPVRCYSLMSRAATVTCTCSISATTLPAVGTPSTLADPARAGIVPCAGGPKAATSWIPATAPSWPQKDQGCCPTW